MSTPASKMLERSLPPNYKWRVVAMLWFCGFFNYADRQAIFSVFPLLEVEMHLDKVDLGLLGSSFALVYGICAPFAGNIVDRIRRKTAVLGGLWAWSIICMLTALATNFKQLLFFRAAEGLGETFYFPASMSMISDYHGKKSRSRAMGFHQTSVYIGTIAGGFFGGLISQFYGWRWSFIVFGGLGVLLGFLLTKFLVEPERGAADAEDFQVQTHQEHRMSTSDFLKVIWTTPTVLLCMGAFMLDNFVGMVLLSWMPAFLYEKFHLSLAMSGLTATIFIQLASMVGSPVGGYLADLLRRRFPGGRIAVQMIGLIGAAPFVVWCGQTLSVSALILALTCWGFFKGLYDANIFASILDVIRPEARGTAVGFMNMIGWLVGAGTAPIVIGYIAQRASLSFAISIASVALLGASALLLIAILFTVGRDVERIRQQLGQS
jgi:MFS family permease